MKNVNIQVGIVGNDNGVCIWSIRHHILMCYTNVGPVDVSVAHTNTVVRRLTIFHFHFCSTYWILLCL